MKAPKVLVVPVVAGWVVVEPKNDLLAWPNRPVDEVFAAGVAVVEAPKNPPGFGAVAVLAPKRLVPKVPVPDVLPVVVVVPEKRPPVVVVPNWD